MPGKPPDWTIASPNRSERSLANHVDASPPMLEPATTIRSGGASSSLHGSNRSQHHERNEGSPPSSRKRRSLSGESGSTAATGGIRPSANRLSSTVGVFASDVYSCPSKRSSPASAGAGGSYSHTRRPSSSSRRTRPRGTPLEHRRHHLALAREVKPSRVHVPRRVRRIGNPVEPVVGTVQPEPVDGTNIGRDLELGLPDAVALDERRAGKRPEAAAN